MANLKISASSQGVDFICSFEGFKAKPYKDTGGLWTIGYGQKITAVESIEYADGITLIEAEQLMQASLDKLDAELSQSPLAGFFQYQYDAIISLAYNIGFEAFTMSTIYKRIISRSSDLSPWLLYVKDNRGVVQAGLQRRRQMEMKLFIYGYQQM